MFARMGWSTTVRSSVGTPECRWKTTPLPTSAANTNTANYTAAISLLILLHNFLIGSKKAPEGFLLAEAQLSPDEMRQLRMEYIAYIPQGSMSVFNPVLKLKEAYEDFVSSHRKGQSREQTFELARQQIQFQGLPCLPTKHRHVRQRPVCT